MRIDSEGTIWSVTYFHAIARGAVFWSNGNKWRKHSSRTARPITDGIPNRSFYFGAHEVCERAIEA